MARNKLFCGIAFNYHDSSIAIGEGDEIKLVLEAERIFRKKKMRCNVSEMEFLVKIGLNSIGKEPKDVNYWAMETLLNPLLDEKDKTPSEPVWRNIDFLGEKVRSLVVNHHLAHASSYLFSPFNSATVLTCDGGGDCGERVTVYRGEGDNLEKVEIDSQNFITAKPYDLISTFLYGYPKAEGKLMALSAFGNPDEKTINILENNLEALCTTDYESGDTLLQELFPGLKEGAVRNYKKVVNLAASLQYLFVNERVNDAKRSIELAGLQNLVLSGGSCLNLEANTHILDHTRAPLFVPSCCDDTGESLGALAYLMTKVNGKRPMVNLPYLGNGIREIAYSENTIRNITDALLDNQIIIVHNSKSEIGPRALGNRSFLARPDSEAMKELLSVRVKSREAYRPLAPLVREDKVGEYFIGPNTSPFMLHQYRLRESFRKSLVGAIHVDDTSRAQTVSQTDNPFIYDLLSNFGDRTGIYALLNTSLNLQGVPIPKIIESNSSVPKEGAPFFIILEEGFV